MSDPPRTVPDPDEVRMTIGEHLDELRGCVVRSLVALILACLLCIWPARYLFTLIARPVVIALRHHGQPDGFLQTGPVETFLMYVKVVLIFGIFLSAPYIIVQIWSFVATGLYRHERRLVYRLAPMSIGLFFAGVTFMYLFVLLPSLNFLIGFGAWLPAPEGSPLPWEKFFMGSPSAAMVEPSASMPASHPAVAFLEHDPPAPASGALWFNTTENKLKLRGPADTYVAPMTPGQHRSMITTHFRLGDYLSFVLALTIAFGLAFQVPLVVVFLVRSGLMRVEQLRGYRKVVILIIVIIAAGIAPPDIFSHLLLSVPMILLFELGLILAARKQRVEAA